MRRRDEPVIARLPQVWEVEGARRRRFLDVAAQLIGVALGLLGSLISTVLSSPAAGADIAARVTDFLRAAVTIAAVVTITLALVIAAVFAVRRQLRSSSPPETEGRMPIPDRVARAYVAALNKTSLNPEVSDGG